MFVNNKGGSLQAWGENISVDIDTVKADSVFKLMGYNISISNSDIKSIKFNNRGQNVNINNTKIRDKVNFLGSGIVYSDIHFHDCYISAAEIDEESSYNFLFSKVKNDSSFNNVTLDNCYLVIPSELNAIEFTRNRIHDVLFTRCTLVIPQAVSLKGAFFKNCDISCTYIIIDVGLGTGYEHVLHIEDSIIRTTSTDYIFHSSVGNGLYAAVLLNNLLINNADRYLYAPSSKTCLYTIKEELTPKQYANAFTGNGLSYLGVDSKIDISVSSSYQTNGLPIEPFVGRQVFDATIKKPSFWNGEKYVDSNGNTSGSIKGDSTVMNALPLTQEDAGYTFYRNDLYKQALCIFKINIDAILTTLLPPNTYVVQSNVLSANGLYLFATGGSSSDIVSLYASADNNTSLSENDVLIVSAKVSNKNAYFTAPNPSDYPYLKLYSNRTSGNLTNRIHEVNKKWIEHDGADIGVLRSGATGSRPVGSSIYVGFQYFDTTLIKPIYVSAISGNTVTWVDATGATV